MNNEDLVEDEVEEHLQAQNLAEAEYDHCRFLHHLHFVQERLLGN
jgi:hypothetical protein